MKKEEARPLNESEREELIRLRAENEYTEEYNLENFELSEWQIESFARILLPSICEYYKDLKHVQEANELNFPVMCAMIHIPTNT